MIKDIVSVAFNLVPAIGMTSPHPFRKNQLLDKVFGTLSTIIRVILVDNNKWKDLVTGSDVNIVDDDI